MEFGGREWPDEIQYSSGLLRSLEHRPDRISLGGWDDVPVSFLHLLGLVAHPGIDQPLINSPRRASSRRRNGEERATPSGHSILSP